MTAQATLDRAQSVGLRLHVDDGQLRLSGDKSALAGLLPELRQYRAELVQLLSKNTIDQMPVAPALDPAKPLPKFHIAQPWNEADKAFQAHYWQCPECKAGGRTRGPLCPTGTELHQQYEQAAMATEGASQ